MRKRQQKKRCKYSRAGIRCTKLMGHKGRHYPYMLNHVPVMHYVTR